MLTHKLNNYGDDPINRRIHEIGFANDGTSAVSVIYVPCYLDGADGIFDMTYYQLLPGLDATVFASYYEPWGYTPLESIAFGVPTLTTSLAGFGCWVKDSVSAPTFSNCGVEVETRTDGNYAETVSAIAKDVLKLVETPETDIEKARAAATTTAAQAQWSDFIKYYYEAYCTAISKCGQIKDKE